MGVNVMSKGSGSKEVKDRIIDILISIGIILIFFSMTYYCMSWEQRELSNAIQYWQQRD